MVVLRRFSIATRAEVFSGQINGAPTADTVTLGNYRFAYDNVMAGAYTDVKEGMTIDIGTTPGARDIGWTRVRKVPTSALMYIAETAPGKLALANDLYFTVRNEYLPWRTLPRGVGAQTGGATYTNDLTLYMDYDVAYTNQNDRFPPKANITRSSSSFLPPKPAGYLDAGEVYRTVTLSAAKSFGVSSALIVGLEWDVEDCTITVGSTISTDITIQVPEGFRYIHLRVSDGNGTIGTMHWPLFAHGDTYAPLLNFKVTSDETSEIGRSMNFEFFGADNSVNETVLPRMSLICYWEEPDNTRPAAYRDQYLGWAKREATLLRLHRTRYTLETTGIAGWLDSFGGSSLYLYDPLETSDRWYEMQDITIDKCAYFILLYFCNAMTICNFYMSGNDYPTKGETIEIGMVWRQVVEMVKGYFGVPGADSLNGIWLRKHYCYLTQDERDAISATATITRDKLMDNAPVSYKNELTGRTGMVIGGGSSFDGTNNTIYASAAPGLVASDEGGEEQAPGQRLPTTGSQTELNRTTGHHYAFVNNPNSDMIFDLIDNLDIFEPALMLPFVYQESMGNVAGLTVNKNYLPRSISITHSNVPGERQKQVSIAAYGETFGNPGDTKPVPVYDTDNPPVIITPPPITPPTEGLIPYTGEDIVPTKMFIGASTSSQAAIATGITVGGTFVWTEISTGLTGNVLWASSDPFNYARIFALTTTGIYTCTPYAFTGWALVANNNTIFGDPTYLGHKIIMSINRQGWMYLMSGSIEAWTTDYGVTWSRSSGTGGTWGFSLYNNDFVVSPFNSGATGWMYKCVDAGGGVQQIYKSTDWGVNWTNIGTISGFPWWGARLNIPYKRPGGTLDNTNDSSQVLYIQSGWGHPGNGGMIYKSVDAGVTWSSHYTYSGAPGQYTVAGSYGGNALQTFTYDGAVILSATLIMGAGGGNVGIRVEDTGSEISKPGLISVGSTNMGSVCVNGFSYHRLAGLMWNQGGTNAEINYTIDGGVNVYSVNLPSFFTGSPKLIGYAEWPLVDQWVS